MEKDVKEIRCIYTVAAEFVPEYDQKKIMVEP